jgi:hypothetical protein
VPERGTSILLAVEIVLKEPGFLPCGRIGIPLPLVPVFRDPDALSGLHRGLSIGRCRPQHGDENRCASPAHVTSPGEERARGIQRKFRKIEPVPADEARFKKAKPEMPVLFNEFRRGGSGGGMGESFLAERAASRGRVGPFGRKIIRARKDQRPGTNGGSRNQEGEAASGTPSVGIRRWAVWKRGSAHEPPPENLGSRGAVVGILESRSRGAQRVLP